MGSWYYEYPARTTVADRAAKARKQAAALEKKGSKLSPVVLSGRTIAATFWGKAWCQNLESYSDYESRLPRGRSYVRSGSVLDLQIAPGEVKALVQGTRLYTVTIGIGAVEKARWASIVAACGGQIDSVIELLQGKFSKAVMEVITSKEKGLFPSPQQIKLSCSCPDWATMCKHVAAVLYGVGARLDQQPDLLFRLRAADPLELVATAASGAVLGGKGPAKGKRLGADLTSVFGIDLDMGEAAPPPQVLAKVPRKVQSAARVASAVVPVPVVASPTPRVASPATKVAAPAPRAAPTRTKAAAPQVVTITGGELRLRGVPPATVQYWLKTGVLLRTASPGVYEETEVSRARMARYPGGT